SVSGVGSWLSLLQVLGIGKQVGKGTTGLWRGASMALVCPRLARTIALTSRSTGTGVACGPGLVAHAHGQADALARNVHFQHLDLDDVAGLDHIARIL